MQLSTKSFVILLFGFIFCQTTAQERHPIEVFTPNEYGAQNQNWAITQSDENLIYVANSSGLLEYNGARWKLYIAPNNSIVRSVKVINEKIFTGFFMDFGYWERDEYGSLTYTSLSKELNLNLLEDEQFWNITELDDWVLFQSLSRIYIVNLKSKNYSIIESDVRITKMINIDGAIYFHKAGKGLFKIENGKETLVNDSKLFKENQVINILRVNSQIICFTDKKGAYVLDGDIPKYWKLDDRIEIENYSIYSIAQLKDKSIVLGTISNGIFHIDKNGDLIGKYDHKRGLSNNTILSIFEDHQNNIWLGLDNGINCINIASKFKVYVDDEGSIGTVYASIIFEDELYIGTNQGIYYKERNNNDKFKFIEGTKGQVWSFKLIDDTLFCGHNNGTYLIKNNKIIDLIDEAPGTWDFKIIYDYPNMILQGNYNGLNILEKSNGNWELINKVQGFDISSRFFEFFDNKLFVNNEFRGLYELKPKNTLSEVESTNITNTVNTGFGSSIIKFTNSLYYSSSEGVYKYDNGTFVRDSIFSSLFSPYKSLSTLLEVNGDEKTLWRFADDNILLVYPGSMSSEAQLESIPISNKLRSAVIGFENLTKLNNQEYLIGTSNGYLIYNKSIIEPQMDYYISINSIEVNKIDKPKISLNKSIQSELENKQNNIKFEYSFPSFASILDNKYQYQLLGLSEKWSEWEEESSQLFENLPFGSYTFNVRGKTGNKLTSNTASYTFEIKRPWFLSNTLIAIYVLSSLLLFIVIHNVYKRYYKKQREKLLEESKKEIELKELENEQQLMHHKNDKLKLDIENKNRELAISTMSLIKKNEFLNNIKNELKNTQDLSKLKSVIKTIDNNINNTDDWKFFEEAFNNADKDFLKKIKSKHPSLTSNDLKLCAYLRLNLSSKEIAPLLNISSRSVEVKRYRLRKKMDLPHESSLTNYILEI